MRYHVGFIADVDLLDAPTVKILLKHLADLWVLPVQGCLLYRLLAHLLSKFVID